MRKRITHKISYAAIMRIERMYVLYKGGFGKAGAVYQQIAVLEPQVPGESYQSRLFEGTVLVEEPAFTQQISF
jgi:hypothetical protein